MLFSVLFIRIATLFLTRALPSLLLVVADNDYLYIHNAENEMGYVQELVTVDDMRSDQLPDFLRNQNQDRFVVFYAPWCPHCQVYAPEYIRIAKEIIADRKSSVQFHAISCSVHRAICKSQSITGYPTILAIKAGTNVTSSIMVHRNKNVDKFLEALTNLTSSEESRILRKADFPVEKLKPRRTFHDKAKADFPVEALQPIRKIHDNAVGSSPEKIINTKSIGRPRRFLLFIILFGFIVFSLLSLSILSRRITLRRSGQHKKNDFPCREIV